MPTCSNLLQSISPINYDYFANLPQKISKTSIIEICMLALPESFRKSHQSLINSIHGAELKNLRSIWIESRISNFNFGEPVWNQNHNTSPNKSVQGITIQLISQQTEFEINPFVVPLHFARAHFKIPMASTECQHNMNAEVCLKLGPIQAWFPCLVTKILKSHEAIIIFTGFSKNHRITSKQHRVPLTHLRRQSQQLTFRQLGGLVQTIIDFNIESFPLMENLLLEGKPFNDSHLLQIEYDPAMTPSQLTVVGTNASILIVKQFVSKTTNEQNHKKLSLEKKARRFKLLAQRRKLCNYNCVMEFEMNKDYLGFIMGHKGNKIGHLAQRYQTELRILPINGKIRTLRILGHGVPQVKQAYTELKFVFQQIDIVHSLDYLTLSTSRSQLETISHESGIMFLWIDEINNSLFLWGSIKCNNAFVNLLRTLL